MKPFGLVVHGGAGVILQNGMSKAVQREHEAVLSSAIDAGYNVLAAQGSALDAVVAAVRVLEDSPLFNSAHGAVLNADGVCELDASIMDGRTQSAGSVAGVQHIRNPITLARDVMEKSAHVMLVGSGAERFAAELGYPLVPNEYFITPRRKLQLEKARAMEAQLGLTTVRDSEQRVTFVTVDDNDDAAENKFGTVGCVALDQHGNLAAGTSTGGMTNKKFGRVGDSPLIGAGTYANNATCAVSATGHGEYFIRGVVGHDISARMEYQGASLPKAVSGALAKLDTLGGKGGVITIDAAGRVALSFNTPGMFRAYRLSSGAHHVSCFQETALDRT